MKQDAKNVSKLVAGLGAVAAALGVYFLYGSKEGPRRRRQLKGWMLRMKGDVYDELENLKDVSREAYFRIIDDVKEKYKNMSNVAKEEAEEMAEELKTGWDEVVDEAERVDEEIVEEKAKRKSRRKTE